MTSTCMRLAVVTSALGLTLIAPASAQQAGPRPPPYVADSSCVQYRPTVQENEPTPRTTLPVNARNDRRYQHCLKRHHLAQWARDSSMARSPGLSERRRRRDNTTPHDTTMVRPDTGATKASPPER